MRSATVSGLPTIVTSRSQRSISNSSSVVIYVAPDRRRGDCGLLTVFGAEEVLLTIA